MLISALLFPCGRGEAALFHIIEGRDRLLISKPLLHELLTVLANKFSHDREELARVAVFLGDLAIKGERGLLKIPGEWLLRMRYNPFYSYLQTRVLQWLNDAPAPSAEGP